MGTLNHKRHKRYSFVTGPGNMRYKFRWHFERWFTFLGWISWNSLFSWCTNSTRISKSNVNTQNEYFTDWMKPYIPWTYEFALYIYVFNDVHIWLVQCPMKYLFVCLQMFDSVTILFSDVVTFTEICSRITPMEVVSMLNAMYSIFDTLTERNKVYKVKTLNHNLLISLRTI